MLRLDASYSGIELGNKRSYEPIKNGGGTQESVKPQRIQEEDEKSRRTESAQGKVNKFPWEEAQDDDKKSQEGFRKKEPGEECQTCKNRKYKDGSDENVSFKAAAHISPEAAASRVRAHEEEHVANAYSKAAEKGGEVLSVSVRIETSVCPECGKNYVSGGTTSTRIKYPSDSEEADKRQQQANRGQFRANVVRGNGFDYVTKPMEEFEMERY